MIPGIEVLSEQVIQNDSGAAISAIVIGAMLAVLTIILGIIVIYDETPIMLFPISIMLIVGAVFIAAGIGELNTKPYTEYKVLISDEVSWNEFNERYEVINQEGKIYTIKEKAE